MHQAIGAIVTLGLAQTAVAGLYPEVTPYNHSCALCTLCLRQNAM